MVIIFFSAPFASIALSIIWLGTEYVLARSNTKRNAWLDSGLGSPDFCYIYFFAEFGINSTCIFIFWAFLFNVVPFTSHNVISLSYSMLFIIYFG